MSLVVFESQKLNRPMNSQFDEIFRKTEIYLMQK